MEWDDATRERLAVALNEPDVTGVRLDPDRRAGGDSAGHPSG